ncbi:acyl-CoA dehydrogenase family protein [Streptomyces chilikensis]|uniref:Acyl-CoA dehydrogenase family protein n=1 Tax=Streptomyces chilikensis TaxID=1194079 RepID=A0ABV3EHX2_9ACTN|nr:acyl-CoA dehydrogenase family protein [Streptomyces chilikensis]
MDLFGTAAHDELRSTVREFAETEIRPRIPELEAERTVSEVGRKLSRMIAEQGWIGATIAPQYQGMGVGHLGKTVLVEELSRVCGAMGAMAQASILGVAKIIHFGDAAQRAAWLPRIARGACLPTIAVTEPGSGGHVLGMTSSAVRDGGDYVLNGRKIHVGNSHVGDLHGVVVRTGPGSRGLSAFLVEADRPGVGLVPQRQSMGLHGFSFGEIVFDGVRVPAAHRLGDEGQGLDIAYSSSTLYGRPNLAAVSLGIHQAVVEETAAFCVERIRYGRPLKDLTNVKIKLGEMQSRLMTARTALYHAVSLLDHGMPCDEEMMNAKAVNAEYAITSARQAMEIHAAAGLFTDRAVERHVRDAFHILAPAGTSDVQYLRLAETALGEGKGSWSVRLAHVARTVPPGPGRGLLAV